MAALGAGTGAFGRVAAGHVLALGAEEPVAGGVGDALGAAQRQTRVILLSNCGFWGRETQKQEQCTCHKVNMHSCNLEGSQQVLVQHVFFPTRYRIGNTPHLLDF